jgi:hypothetical protein
MISVQQGWWQDMQILEYFMSSFATSEIHADAMVKTVESSIDLEFTLWIPWKEHVAEQKQ